MRKRLFMGALAGLALVGVVSCSSETPQDVEQNVLQLGDPTFANLSVYIKTAETRADADDTTDPVEQVVSEINFFIFSNGVLEKHHKQMISSDIPENVAVPVSTGTKTIYAVTTGILDNNDAVKEKLTTSAKFEEILMSALCNDRSTGVNIATSRKFVMIGKETKVYITKCTEEEAAKENPVKIGIDRAAAKVQVIYPDNSNSTGVENTAVVIEPNLNARFINPYFDVAQSIKQMRLITDASKSAWSPIGTKDGTGTYSGFNEVNSSSLSFIAAPRVSNPGFESNKYTGECVTENPVTGNSSFAVVKIKCEPKSIYNNASLTDGTFYVLAYNYKTSGTWSFVSGEDKKMLYFATNSEAEAYKNTNGIALENYSVYQYINGITYYRIDLVHDMDLNDGGTELHRILRNNYYRARVKSIEALGSPTVEGLVPEDPDTPIQKDSYLSAEITVNPWTAHDWDVNLE